VKGQEEVRKSGGCWSKNGDSSSPARKVEWEETGYEKKQRERTTRLRRRKREAIPDRRRKIEEKGRCMKKGMYQCFVTNCHGFGG